MLRKLKTALRTLFCKSEMERELDEELRYHIEQQTEQNFRLGMSPEEARSAALRAFGGVEQAKERSRDARGIRWLEELWQDFRYGGRMLVKIPGFTFAAVLTLSLGIGANTAIFTIVNAVLLRPLPYRDPDRLMRLWETTPQLPTFSISGPNYRDWADQNRVFEQMAAWREQNFNLTNGGDPERLGAALVTASFFPLLGVKLALGRSFIPEEDQPGANNRFVIMSDRLWHRRFGTDANILGKTLTLNGGSYTVVGIMGPEFQFGTSGDLWLPLALDPLRDNRSNHILTAAARLKPGVTLDQARAEMDNIARRLEEQYPNSNKGWGVKIATFYDWIIEGQFRQALLILLGAVGLVLLIACANVANLLLSRAATRQKEIAIRSALGASRLRLIRQLLTESVILALAGGGLGVLLAWWGVDAFIAANPGSIPRLREIGLDNRVLAFTFTISLLTGLLFGLAPALQASRIALNEFLKEGGRTSAGFGLSRLRRLLIVSEIAFALVLLVGAGLLMKSFLRLQQVNLGFDPDRVLTLQLTLPRTKYPEARQQADFYQQMLERVRNLPGVRFAGASSSIPFPRGGSPYSPFFPEGRQLSPEKSVGGNYRLVSPDYFRAMGIPLLKGRDFTNEDNGERQPVVVISDETARRLWPGEEPLGKRLQWGGSSQRFTVVGVVGDIRSAKLEAEPSLAIYVPSIQPQMYLVARTATEPMSLAAAIRSQVQAMDKDQPIANLRTMEQVVSNSISQRRFSTLLLGLFAVVALLIASIGVYAVMSYSVAQRTREVGIRMALGAQSGDVLKLVLGQGMKLIGVGIVIGLVGAVALTRWMATLLFEVKPTDPLTLVGVAALLAAVALLACWLPAWRATKVDPVTALHSD
jgi:putative ABC transport system permease protein